MYSPALSAVSVLVWPRSTSITETMAPAMAPPVWSVTVPRIRPAFPWEKTGRLINNTPRHRHTARNAFKTQRAQDASTPNATGCIGSTSSELSDSPLNLWKGPLAGRSGYSIEP